MKIFDQYKGLRRENYVLFFGNIVTNMGSMVWPMMTLLLDRKLGMSAGNIALLMMDCNGLKQINDRYGHEKGDLYLRASCALICDTFPHSPVFRLGGDEFAVVLQAAPFRERDGLLRAFDERAAEANAAARQPWEQIRIAKGLAVYDPALDHSLDDTLHRADEIMYEDKRRSKAAAGLPPDAR